MTSTATNHPRQIDFSFWAEGAPPWAIDAKMKVMAWEYGPVMLHAWKRVEPELDRYYLGRMRIHKLAALFLFIMFVGMLTLAGLLMTSVGNQMAKLLAFFALWGLAMIFQYLIVPYILRKEKARHCFLIEV